MDDPAPQASATPHGGEEVLDVVDVRKVFHGGPLWHRRRVEVLRGARLHVDAGELVGLVGENGSGKSTLELPWAVR